MHVGCWAHVRRAFKEAADAQGKVSSRAGTARQAVAYIAKLYRIESELSDYREQDPDRFAAERRAQVEPVLEKMHGWLRQKQDQVLPGSALGKAIAFALGQWPKLIRYLELAVLRQPARRHRERTVIQLDRNGQGERARTVLVPA